MVRSEAEALLLENNLIKTLDAALQHPVSRRQELSVPEDRVARAFRASPTTAARSTSKHRYFGPYPERLGGEGIDPAAAEGVPPAHLRGHGVRQPHAALPAVPDQALLGPVRRLHRRPRTTRSDVANAERFLQGEHAGADGLAAGADDGARRGAASSSRRPSCATRSAALSRVLHQQSVEDNTGVRPATSTSSRSRSQGGQACVNLAMVRGGRHLGDRPYFPTHVEDAIDDRSASEADAEDDDGARPRRRRRPRCRCSRPSSPSTTSTAACRRCWSLSHAVDKALIEALSPQQRRAASPSLHQPREQRRAWLEMCIKGAELQLARLLAEEGSQQARTRALVDALDLAVEDLDTVPRRVLRHQPHRRRGDAGVVRGVRGPQDAELRSTAATTSTASRRGDDYAAMRQVLTRRYAKLVEAAAPGRRRGLPDLVLVDGGRGQVVGGARGVRGARPRAGADRRRREGRGPQGRPGGAGVRRRPRRRSASAASRRR